MDLRTSNDEMRHAPRLDDPRGGQFHGGVTRRREVGGAVMVYTAPTPDAATEKPMHWHARPYFWMLIDGDCSERIKGVGERLYSPMVLTYHPEGEMHSHHSGKRPPSGFGIVLTDELLIRVRNAAPISNEPAVLFGHEFTVLAERIWEEFRLDDGASNLALEGLTIELLAQVSRSMNHPRDTTPPRWLIHAIELLHACFAENVRFTEVAASVGIHPVHLAAEFRRHFGCTMGDSLRAIRISAVKRELRGSHRSIADIASACGFYDEPHLCRTFKSATGMTPTQYRVRAEP